ncbi:AAA family ATPase [Microvirga tunisiensis]|uniref:AAA family ATPase n=1 Tax=Microvirga tunisiensis TaxID=2108360 RepID=UPI001386FA0E|nr:AAA family ATPase [Microvirga tunisiensis]
MDRLADVCDARTKLIVIGSINDIQFYRSVIDFGAKDYLISPVVPDTITRSIANIYQSSQSKASGRLVAVIGASGGTGASTIAHNLAWTAAEKHEKSTLLVDMDVAFGSAALNFNINEAAGKDIAEALFSTADRIDEALITNLISPASDKLELLSAPCLLDRTCDFDKAAVDKLLDVLRATSPLSVIDVPHAWTSWVYQVLAQADEIIVVTVPDLAGLRNTKNLFAQLMQLRASDQPPLYVLNMTEVPKKQEITVAEFSEGVGVPPTTVVPYDVKNFATAANNGQMICQMNTNARITKAFEDLSVKVTGETMDPPKARANSLASLGSLTGLLNRFRKPSAAKAAA